ncbi:MAG TPA: TonB-dependent receptor [Thermoanaerobaculia bacterium]|nr:TonB-dependent receptor [Thermoanaerobaculia bacterium]
MVSLWGIGLALPWVLAAATPTPPTTEVVYETATVVARPVDSTAVAVAVVGRESIESSGAATVAELLPFLPGVSMLSGGTRGGLTAVQLRGGDPNFTRVLIDGVPVNDGTTQVGEVFNLEGLPAAGVERIEVVRGPLSAVYGSTGLAGAVQIVTRRGEGPLHGEVAATAGQAREHRLAAWLGGGNAHADGFLSALREGERERIASERFELSQLSGQGHWSWNEGTSLRLAGRLASWQGDDYPDASGGPVYGDGELRRADNDETGLTLDFARETAATFHKFGASFYRHDLDRTSPAIEPLVPESRERTRFTHSRLSWSSSWLRSGGLRLSAGSDLEREEGNNESRLRFAPGPEGEVPGDYSLDRTTAGAFVELLGERGRLAWELAYRLDRTEGERTEQSPRVGASYRIGPGATRLRASVGRAFKRPGFFATASPPALGGNPDLRPEVALGADLGIEHRIERANLALGAGVFRNRFRDLVDFDFETFRHVNRSRVEARGAELTAAWQPPRSVSLQASATWQEVEDERTGAPLRHRPRWSGGLRLTGKPASRLQIALDLRFATKSFDEQIPVPERRTVSGYTLLGGAIAWQATPAWRLALRFDNLADERYETLIGFPGAGRSARLTVARGFGGGEARR